MIVYILFNYYLIIAFCIGLPCYLRVATTTALLLYLSLDLDMLVIIMAHYPNVYQIKNYFHLSKIPHLLNCNILYLSSFSVSRLDKISKMLWDIPDSCNGKTTAECDEVERAPHGNLNMCHGAGLVYQGTTGSDLITAIIMQTVWYGLNQSAEECFSCWRSIFTILRLNCRQITRHCFLKQQCFEEDNMIISFYTLLPLYMKEKLVDFLISDSIEILLSTVLSCIIRKICGLYAVWYCASLLAKPL